MASCARAASAGRAGGRSVARAAGAAHLKALACLSRMLRDARLLAQLRGAVDADAMHALIAAAPRIQAA